MTFLFDHERQCFAEHGPADAYVFQSEFQRSELEPRLAELGYTPDHGHLIPGAFDLDELQFSPRPHAHGEVFVVGRMARPDLDKWSSNTWPIYTAIQYRYKRALMLGMDDRTHGKLGAAPAFADCLKPMAISVQQFLATLHCLLPINGGARENWPRAGLEAMAAGVPIVAQNDWGWREMIEHGVTGFLGSDDCELAHYAAMLAHDEELRLRVIDNARERLVTELVNPVRIWAGWQRLFDSSSTETRDDHDRRYPIDPWPGEPMPDEYDLLIYAKNGHRPMLLEHLAEVFPRHVQIHYGQYQREQLFESARRSRSCAYLADDDHGPLSLQEILLAGCPTVGVRTGASFVKTGETGVLVDRLPPGRQCVETDEDERALAVYLEAIAQAQAIDRQAVRNIAAAQFHNERIVDQVITALVKSLA